MSYCPLDLVEGYVKRFVIYPSEHARVAHVLWIAHAHLMDCWENTPRLAFMSAEKESGKTRALEITALFVPEPELVFNPSPAALIRIVAAGMPTILHDEIDNVFRSPTADDKNATLLGILNQGYRPGATVPRCVGQGMNISVDRMPCYCPVAFAGLRTLPDTLASRSIFIHMKRRARDEHKEPFQLRYARDDAQKIMTALSEWLGDIKEVMYDVRPVMPNGIEDRTADIWEPLFAIADRASDDWPARGRAAAVYLTGSARDDILTDGVELLAHIKEAFLGADKIWTSSLLQRLRDREESPWNDAMKGGKPLDDRGLALRLKPYGIKSKNVKLSGEVRKGYDWDDFADAWKRYLPASPSGTATSATSATHLYNKSNLVAEVAEVADGRGDLDDLEVARGERAACLEYDCGLPREVAEAMATNEIPPFLRKRTA